MFSSPFLQVPPVDYFKHVILDLQNETGTPQQQQQQQQQAQLTKSTVRALQKRFEEVSEKAISLTTINRVSRMHLKMSTPCFMFYVSLTEKKWEKAKK